MKKKLIYYNWGILPYILIIIPLITILITTIVFSVRVGKLETDGFIGLITPIVFFILGVIGLIFGSILMSVKSRQKKIDTWSLSNVESTEPDRHDIPMFELKKELTLVKDKEAIDWNKIHPLIIKQRNVDEKCPICKLPIEKEDFIVHCPYCLKLFHGKHLIEWLLDNKNCPICRKRIDIR